MPRTKTQYPQSGGKSKTKKLEVVLKCDVAGTEEAIVSSIAAMDVPGVDIRVIQSGVGNVSKTDITMALTGSKLVVGFNVDIMPKLHQEIKEHGVEVRLYDTIYNLTEDIKKISGNLFAKEPEERVTGKAKIIATFKGGRKGIIIGCEVTQGAIEAGKLFRVITAMGPAYTGRIKSLQVDRKNVKSGKPGQQVGLKIDDWKKAKIGDLIECYEIIKPSGGGPWKPKPGVFRFRS